MADAYEELPYPRFAFPQTHPDRLALVATLHGLEPAPPGDCRVLEVGCADGLNLVAMAAHARGLRGVGVDRAAAPLERGRALAAALDLDTVELLALDLREARPELGEFDYVVAHGLYAWAPPAVREALMALLDSCLAPAGVAFVSYNARPGTMARRELREMALMHAGGAGSPAQRVARGRELFDLLAPWARERPDPYGRLIEYELERLRGLSTASLGHDDLGELYEPCWLRDVAEHAARHGLRYLGDAEVADLRDGRHPEGVDEVLDGLAGGDRVTWEQYADFLAGRAFRETLLCRADAQPSPLPGAAALERLWASATEEAGLASGGEGEAAAGGNGAQGVAVVAHLALRRPARLAFDELRAALGAERGPLKKELLRAFRAGEVDLHAAPARHADTPGPLPEASPLARLQAREGPELTNLRHEPVRLDDPFGRHLVTLLDGTRDRPALVDALVAAVGREVRIVSEGEPIADGEQLRGPIADGLERNLFLLAHLGLLHS